METVNGNIGIVMVHSRGKVSIMALESVIVQSVIFVQSVIVHSVIRIWIIVKIPYTNRVCIVNKLTTRMRLISLQLDCNRFNYEQEGTICTTLKPVNNTKSATYTPNNTTTVTVNCTDTTASFPGCKWVQNETGSKTGGKCVLNSS